MFLNLSIELYEDFGKWVYIAEDNSCGAKYTYNDKDELKEIISNYINEMIDNEVGEDDDSED